MNRIKRAFDLILAAAGVLLLLPVSFIIGAAILIDDGPPVFFRQVRIGRHGRPFRIWKFRTMAAHARTRALLLTIGADPRITRTGSWLRRWKLDELPQLINVVRGQMSLVGPRPEVPRYVDRYTPEQRRVLELTPGITDPASIRYRNESELLAHAADPERTYVEYILPHKLQLNLAYAERATLWSDIGVIVRTLLPWIPPEPDVDASGWQTAAAAPVIRRRRRLVR